MLHSLDRFDPDQEDQMIAVCACGWMSLPARTMRAGREWGEHVSQMRVEEAEIHA